MKRNTRPLRLNALTTALMMRAMIDEPCTVRALCDVSGLARHTIWRYLRALIKVKVIRVAEWESDALGRPQIPAYQLGAGPDVARPKQPRTRKSRRAQRYARDKQLAMVHLMAGPVVLAEAA